MPRSSFRVLVAGGGIAGIEGLLALRDLAGDRVALALVTPGERFRLRPFAVAEPFGLGQPREVPYARIARDVGAQWFQDSVAEVDDAARELRSAGGRRLGFEALLIAVGGREVDAFEPAMTWRPERAGELFSGLLREIEGGHARRVERRPRLHLVTGPDETVTVDRVVAMPVQDPDRPVRAAPGTAARNPGAATTCAPTTPDMCQASAVSRIATRSAALT